MIQISHLSKGYAHQELLSDISFTIHKGEKLGLVGRNGHGKTTLFRMLAGLETQDSGTIQFPKGYKIAYLKQEMHFTHSTVLDEVLSALPEDELKESWRAEKILSGLDFTEEMMHQSPNVLSGGWMNRINLAKVLISEADMLLLDEPTNHLDIVTIHWLMKFLQEWRKELILITHDRMFMDAIVNHTVAIHRRQIRKIAGNSQKIYDQIAQEEEIYEKTRINDEKEKERVEQFIRKFRAKARLAGMVQSRIKSLEKKEKYDKLDHIENLDFQFHFKEFETRNMISVDDLSFGYTNELLIEKLSLDIFKGERVAIIGKNGKGKSTLLRLIAEQLSPVSGMVKHHPKLITSYYGQVAEQELNPYNTIEEEIASVLPSHERHQARNIAGAMLFEGPLALKKCEVLSGGEKARVLLGKIIAKETHCLFLDEPSNHLDMQSVDSLIEALDYFNGAMVFVTHNELMLHALATKLVVFDRGTVTLFPGTYQEFLNDVGFSEEEKKPKINKIKLTKEEKKERQKLLLIHQQEVRDKQHQIKTLEQQIDDEEQQIKQIQADLITASGENDGTKLETLSKDFKSYTQSAEDNFILLEQYYTELEQLQQKTQELKDSN